MKLYTAILMIFSFFIFTDSYAERYIVPTKYENQEEALIQGSPIIISKKINQVLMYQTCETIDANRANFFFSIKNDTDQPIHFYCSNLRVTDQDGREVKVINKADLLAAKKSQRNWKAFGSAMTALNDSLKAQKAGTMNYQTTTNSCAHSNFNSYGSKGWQAGSANAYSSSTTYGTVHCEALRQQALRQAQIDSDLRNHAIQSNYAKSTEDIHNFYFDSNTIFPTTIYSANVQIEVPKKIEKELQYLLFTFDLGTETHTFSFFCGEKVKKWYHFGR